MGGTPEKRVPGRPRPETEGYGEFLFRAIFEAEIFHSRSRMFNDLKDFFLRFVFLIL